MNRRMITRILTKKHEDFLQSIEDLDLRKAVNDNAIITGGSIASLLLNEPVKDFDYYFRNKATCKQVADYYVKKFNAAHPEIDRKPIVQVKHDRIKIMVKSAGVVSEKGDAGYEYFESLPDEFSQKYVEKVVEVADETDSEHLNEMEKERYRPVFMSANAITLSNKVQLVLRFYGNPEEIHKNYDFVHCTNYWTAKDNKLVLNQLALESLLSRQLQYMGSLYPVCSIIRARKFLKQGWHINAGQYLKMCFQVSELDLTDIEVLEEQLTGVDAAYFFQVIDYCKKRQEADPNFRPDGPYLISIIDKIFG